MQTATIQLKQGIGYAIEENGVTILNNRLHKSEFISYPDAAIWLVLARNNDLKVSQKMISAILNLEKNKCNNYINSCLNNWKNYFLFNG
ncbi:MAG: hypothetical protein PF517_21940 [Salinivirgaceae bacterium]|jgi:hypothetical protein|nr:hypothetical protein [Salinivirgaceae bacterium]